MKEELRFEQLKEYLTREYMKYSDQRDGIVGEKIQLETKKEKEEKPLFEGRQIENRKRLFSPLSDEIYENGDSSREQKDEVSRKITELEEKLNSCDDSMEEIKEYLSFLQQMEDSLKNSEEEIRTEMSVDDQIDENIVEVTEDSKDSDDEDIAEMTESLDNSNDNFFDMSANEEGETDLNLELLSEDQESEVTDITDMIFDTAEFLEEQYPEIQFVVDFEDNDYEMDYNMSANLVRIITYALSSTIESVVINSVEVEIKKEEENLLLSIKMLYNDKVLSQHTMWISKEKCK